VFNGVLDPTTASVVSDVSTVAIVCVAKLRDPSVAPTSVMENRTLLSSGCVDDEQPPRKATRSPAEHSAIMKVSLFMDATYE
jgi:hypothetical protein